jgi:hypothetical protein
MVMRRLLLLSCLTVVPLAAQDADDLKRGVARISLINGDVSVRRGDSGDWVAAGINTPLVAQDWVSTGPNARTEVQFDYSNMLRVGANSEVRLTELEYRRYQIQVARGIVTFRVLRDSNADIDINTPSVSVRPRRRGIYRIGVREDGESEITVRSGEAEIFTPRGTQELRSGQTMFARGTAAEPEFQIAGAIDRDDWDRWNEDRDRDLERGSAYRYVSRDIYGAEDLDAHGRWVHLAPYGYVWRPTVVVDWAPYRHGRWVWIDWYGWTWVGYEPWGWAPYHYGRWFWSTGYGWCWYPGAFRARHYWSPALVGFVGFGRGVSFGVGFGWGRVGWVPLAPYERFHRWWGRGFYGGYRNSTYIDRSVNITNVNITNIYRNARVRNGVTAVDAGDFSRGRFRNIARLSNDDLRQANLVQGRVPLAPGDAHLRFSDRQVTNIPRTSENQRFFSRRQPQSVERVAFADQRRSLERISRVPVVASERSPGTGSGTPAERGAVGRSERTRGFRAAENSQGGAAVQGAAPQNADSQRGWRRSNEPARSSAGSNVAAAPDAGARSVAGEQGRGWRRAGENSEASASEARGGQGTVSRSESRGERRRFSDPSPQTGPGATPANGGPSPSGERANEARPEQRVPRNDSRGAWRRFGDRSPQNFAGDAPPSGGGAPSVERANQAPGEQRAVPRSESRGGWRRFGEPSQGTTAISPRSNDRAVPGERQSGWSRFGDPGAAQAAPQRNEGSVRRESENNWRRFENAEPRGDTRSDRVERSAPRSERQRFDSPRAPESINITPPVVRERSSQRTERSGGGFSRSGGEYRGSAPSGRSSGVWRGGDSGAGRISRGSGGGGTRSSGGGMRSSGGGGVRSGGGGSPRSGGGSRGGRNR